MTGSRLLSASVVVAVTLGLVACSTPPAGTAGTTEPATRSPSPSSSAVALEAPTSLFPGDCTDFVAPAVIADVVGSDVELADDHPSAAFIADFRQSGILRCGWSDGADADRHYLGLSLYRHADLWQSDALGGPFVPTGLPGAAVGADLSGIACSADPLGATQCQIYALADDYAVEFHARTTRYPDLGAALTPVVRELVSTLRSSPVPEGWAPPSGAWPLPLDCAVIEASARVGDALGVPELSVHDATGTGEDYALTPELASIGGRWDCVWSDGDSTADPRLVVYATMVSGGGWALAARPRTSDEQRISIAGADEAVMTASAESGHTVTLRMGVNILTIGPGLYTAPLTEAQATASARRIAAALTSIYGTSD